VSGRRLLLALGLWALLAAAVVAATALGLRILAPGWTGGHLADLSAIVIAELYLALLMALLVAFGPAGVRDRLGFRFTSVGHLGLALVAWVAALVLGSIATAALSPLLGPAQSNTVELLGRSFDPLFVGLIVPTVCLLAPAGEELLFRGALYGWLRGHLPALPTIALTAAVFAAAHVLPPLLPILFVFGVAAALMREWTGSTLNSFVMHASQNTLAVAVTYTLLSRHVGP
jgi:membrane protease YdiL (CAAX protease family)